MTWCVKFVCHEENYTFDGESLETIAKEVLGEIPDPNAIRYLEVSQISQESEIAFKKLLQGMNGRDGDQIRKQKRLQEATDKLDREFRTVLHEIEKQREFLNPRGLRNLVELKKSSLVYWCHCYPEPLRSELKEKYSALLEKAIYGEPAS